MPSVGFLFREFGLDNLSLWSKLPLMLRMSFMTFVGERVEVETEKGFGEPKVVVWRGKSLKVHRVLRWWHNFSYGSYRYLPRRWWLKKRRLYFEVEFEDGRTARIYRDLRQKEWVLLCFLQEER